MIIRKLETFGCKQIFTAESNEVNDVYKATETVFASDSLPVTDTHCPSEVENIVNKSSFHLCCSLNISTSLSTSLSVNKFIQIIVCQQVYLDHCLSTSLSRSLSVRVSFPSFTMHIMAFRLYCDSLFLQFVLAFCNQYRKICCSTLKHFQS